ncbi:MAG: hypothetical protein NT013_24075 [Planctomycetia bacterium]|nr:hypothetical protein [Planctomycetia bacterium]
MTWFESLTGFHEASPKQVRDNISVDDEMLKSHANGKHMACGRLETPTLAELRDRVRSCGRGNGTITVRELIGEAQQLHANVSNAGSLYQVASQFNLLEMVSPGVTPEAGIGIYENDHTQGPACAIACGAGTIYRNYFASVNGQTGQSANNQIDCTLDIGNALGNSANRLWQMRNGYCLASESGLVEISDRLRNSSEGHRDELRRLLRIGIQWRTQVTINDCEHLVSQAYCSALPVAYSPHSPRLWEPFARLVLEASYEAAICAAIWNSENNGTNKLFLTLLGGGAFGNHTEWITDAVQCALARYVDFDLDVAIVSYRSSTPGVQQLVEQFSKLDKQMPSDSHSAN